jgi:hypothetical protein
VPRASLLAAPRLRVVRAPLGPGEAERPPRRAGVAPMGWPSGTWASQARPPAPVEPGWLHSEARPWADFEPTRGIEISILFSILRIV